MKRLFSTLLVALFVSLTTLGDNYIAPSKSSTAFTDTTTTHTYQIKDIKYPIYKSKSNKYYIWKISKKTGKKYKYYLPKKVQEKIK